MTSLHLSVVDEFTYIRDANSSFRSNQALCILHRMSQSVCPLAERTVSGVIRDRFLFAQPEIENMVILCQSSFASNATQR